MIKRAILALYAVLILAAIFVFNPKLFSRDSLVEVDSSAMQIWKPVSFAKADQGGSPIAFYRQSDSREAQFKVTDLKFDLKPSWKTDGLNVGIHRASKSSVIGDGDQIYVGSDSSWFYAFRKTGELVWKAFLGEAARGIHSTAAIDEKSVYIGSYRGTLYRLDKKTGSIIWMRIVGQTIGASPLIDNDSLTTAVEINKPDGYLIRVRKDNGEIIWKTQNLGEQAHSSPSLDQEHSVLVVGVNNSTIQGFNYQTGERLWSFKVGGPVKSTIVIKDGIGYATTWGAELLAFETSSGKFLWKYNLSDKSQVSPIVLSKSNIVFAGDMTGHMFGVDRSSGKLKWKLEFPQKRQLSSPLVLTDGHDERILFHCEERALCLISSAGVVERKWVTHGAFTASPFLDSTQLYLVYDEGGIETFMIQNEKKSSK